MNVIYLMKFICNKLIEQSFDTFFPWFLKDGEKMLIQNVHSIKFKLNPLVTDLLF